MEVMQHLQVLHLLQIYMHAVHTLMFNGLAVQLPDDPPRPNQYISMVNVPLFHIHGLVAAGSTFGRAETFTWLVEVTVNRR